MIMHLSFLAVKCIVLALSVTSDATQLSESGAFWEKRLIHVRPSTFFVFLLEETQIMQFI